MKKQTKLVRVSEETIQDLKAIKDKVKGQIARPTNTAIVESAVRDYKKKVLK